MAFIQEMNYQEILKMVLMLLTLMILVHLERIGLFCIAKIIMLPISIVLQLDIFQKKLKNLLVIKKLSQTCTDYNITIPSCVDIIALLLSIICLMVEICKVLIRCLVLLILV